MPGRYAITPLLMACLDVEKRAERGRISVREVAGTRIRGEVSEELHFDAGMGPNSTFAARSSRARCWRHDSAVGTPPKRLCLDMLSPTTVPWELHVTPDHAHGVMVVLVAVVFVYDASAPTARETLLPVPTISIRAHDPDLLRSFVKPGDLDPFAALAFTSRSGISAFSRALTSSPVRVDSLVL
ncbi:hypothetical protein E2562_024620 [Oryza meyeriana var. granulata]|uniref:Uncharacterized protein n=1 Tax=Oryza meyeriana var. granulata TaxID=110450 RepID=A0A6G1DMT4_9ORYZ|nr:hypothetical protein E2562_024620 [Oryza meyeriana var. granulata]